MAIFRRLFARAKVREELSAEMRAHLEENVRELMKSGTSRREAQFAARRFFGNPAQIEELGTDVWRLPKLESLIADVRFALRGMRKSPAFTLTVVLSLALGIGANTAIFSVVDGLILKSLPVRHPEELVMVQGDIFAPMLKSHLPFDDFPPAAYQELRDHNTVFTGMLAFADMDRPDVAIGGVTQAFGEVQMVSGNFFTVLGVDPIAGRPITEDDERASNAVAVISHSFWKRRFAMEPSVVGQKVAVNNVVLEIIGIAPPRFFGVSPDEATDMWVPLALQNFLTLNPDGTSVNVLARLKNGVSAQRASAQLTALYRGLPESLQFKKGNSTPATLTTAPGSRGYSNLREQFTRPLQVLTIVAIVVLLTACANIASLLLARATARCTEMSTRLAIGASRGRLIRQLLTESCLLGIVSGLAALVLARWGNSAMLGLLPSGAAPLNLHWDVPLLGFAAAVSILTGVICGLAPALRGTRINLAVNVQNSTVSGSGLFLNRILVVCQIALSVLLLVSASLFIGTLRNLKNVNLGFNPESLVQVSIDTRAAGYDGAQIPRLFRDLQQQMAAIPGVRSVTAVRNGILQNGNTSRIIFVSGYTLTPGEGDVVESADVGPQFFETTGLPLVAGRDFRLTDTADAPKVVIISESLARRYFPGERPVGKRIGVGSPSLQFEVIGVAKEARLVTLRHEAGPMLYVPVLQTATRRLNAMELRTIGDPRSVIASARQKILALNRRMLVSVEALPQEIDGTLIEERMVGDLSVVFGVLALLLTAGGLYGLLSYSVTRRTKEIGIRTALGAGRGRVIGMILRETLALVGIGLAIGIPLTLAVGRVVGLRIAGLLFGVKPGNPIVIAAAALPLVICALLAGYLPAQRAASLDQMLALRHE